MPAPNVDTATVDGFGREWERFDQSQLTASELNSYFLLYFAEFPWASLPPSAIGFDMGCGSGRWARLVAPRVGRLHCVDPSPVALGVARQNLAEFGNCEFIEAAVGTDPLPTASMDFGYSLGVLHHIPDTAAGLAACVDRLKPGAPFLLYLYYDFDNRPPWFRALWWISDRVRRGVCRLPFPARAVIAEIIALGVYLPLARLALLFERLGFGVEAMPLAFYRGMSLYSMRTDALDRFGTRLERRFSAARIRTMMEAAGLSDIHFNRNPPHWCAWGRRRLPETQLGRDV